MSTQPISPTRCLIIDDEPSSRRILKTHISEMPRLTLIKTCEDALQGLQCISKLRPDLVFLDINMPELSGLELLEMVPWLGSSVIVTSAHQKYAIDGYDYDVLGFLSKPVSYKSFVKAVTNALDKKQKKSPVQQSQPEILSEQSIPATDYPLQTPHFDATSLWVKFDRRLFAIPYQNICFIEGQHNYVAIFCTGGNIIRTRASISEIGRGLPGHFVKTHRSYIVNRYQVNSIEGSTIKMLNNYKVSIAKDERNEIILRLTTGFKRMG
ncbi:DNA-binding LytR/AlgR family response regulator [Dyadobacter sp. BE34]|uniref:DNA-binding LytR/AlgR family response regulator n=1 Tax=Dyadobacter fermentans TaxID=94254 RepID=A0ABU1R8Y0_9BACT|nr:MULTISPECIES: LytTR family DNA-binding domain-containing protein [Dyadobacter]MDR6809657.1 DNA-binding LytR/AlgR family response regulator [Dyadobacter fermentans]MDR7047335.1 DNA-binding LytR/AlgR family response regulator [Dyadobacter sp. BE242]MDR7201570.1 DNA-binding LytR/AlgR family response regulator [Dyadobacter sp. BE34]MDR7219440.1 DNA-binding LytR/AlgR family response regulator [Dyadobacter sp. BE31]MDR7267165.1 DNA-binding LytR/AlgR family response regulator [Dyadobacter sp. BE32